MANQISTNSCVVVDSCVIASWMLSEKNKDSAYVRNVTELIFNNTLLVTVPTLFYDEMLNIILKHIYTNQLTLNQAHEHFETIQLISKSFENIDQPITPESLNRRFQLARKHNLRSYDAIYLDLALTQHCKLATLDQRLSRAAQTENCFFQA